MCFLLGVVAYPARRFEDELMDLRYFSRWNRDGWGFGWYSNRNPIIFKTVQDATRDAAYVRMASTVFSNILIAHLRAKTRGNIREVNSHPFSSGRYLFAHNGTMDKEPLEKELKGRHKELEGDTDSERLFHFILQNVEKYGSVHGIRRALRSIGKMVDAGAYAGYMNILLSDGIHFFAFSKWFRSRARGLHYLLEDGFSPRVVVATRPIFDDPRWKKLQSGELLIVDSSNMEVRLARVG